LVFFCVWGGGRPGLLFGGAALLLLVSFACFLLRGREGKFYSKKRLRNARLGSEARNRRDVTLLRERLLSILSSLSSLKGKRRESSSDEVQFQDGRVGRHGEFCLVVSTPALVLCCGWLGRFGAAAARLEMPVARKGKAMVRAQFNFLSYHSSYISHIVLFIISFQLSIWSSRLN
jgi:hypothetical protein